MSRSQEECTGTPGKVAPTIDRNRCEGKDDCVQVCPYDVFEMGTISKEQRTTLSLKGRLKAWPTVANKLSSSRPRPAMPAFSA